MPDLSEFEQLDQIDDLRRALENTQAQLKRAKARTADLVEATMQGAREAMLALGPLEPVPAPRSGKRAKGKREVALWHLTDWQGAKVTTSYNSAVMRERVLRFCDKAEKLTEIQRTHHPVDECVILFGGDMIEGLFQFPAQPFEIDATLFGQFSQTARLQAEVVLRALSSYQKVTVISEWGNHGRVGSKRAVVPPADNVDRMTYELARAILSDLDGRLHPRLVWEDSEEDIRRVEIGNYRALLIHADEIGRNGFASPMTMVKTAAQWKSGSYPWPFRDVYSGHFHTHNEWSLPDGEGSLYQTGSPESDNRYARETMGAASKPSQRLHFIEPVGGRVTAQYKVWLDA